VRCAIPDQRTCAGAGSLIVEAVSIIVTRPSIRQPAHFLCMLLCMFLLCDAVYCCLLMCCVAVPPPSPLQAPAPSLVPLAAARL
jgi:hypothetical protein